MSKNLRKYDLKRVQEATCHSDALNPMVEFDGHMIRILPPERCMVHIKRYEIVNELKNGSCVIDCPCGYGYGSKILDYDYYTGVDVDFGDVCIPYAIDLYSTRYAQFIKADATKPLDLEQADTVLCVEGLEHVTNPQDMLKNFYNWTKRELFVTFPHNGRKNAELIDGKKIGTGYHFIDTPTKETLELIKEAGFDIVKKLKISRQGKVTQLTKYGDIDMSSILVKAIKV